MYPVAHTSSHRFFFSFVLLQSLFRKIVVALSGTEMLLAKQEDMVDVNLKLKLTSSQSNKQQQAGSGCAC
jgi:Ras-related protein Rab-6A